MKHSLNKRLLTLILALTMTLSLGAAGIAPIAAESSFEFQILFTGDLHGCFYDWSYSTNANYSGLARIAAKINELRDDNTILLDMGDSIQGNGTTVFHTDPAWEGLYPVLAGMEYLDYDLWVLGNHEFNFGIPALEKAYGKGLGKDGGNLFSGAVLAGNVFDADDKPVYGSYWIKEFDNGLRVAIIGMTNPNIDRWDATNLDKAGYHTESATVCTEATIKYLKDNKLADIFIAAEHMDQRREYEREGSGSADVLANAYNAKNLSLFIGAHGHGNVNTMLEGVRYVEIGANGARMGQLNISVSKTKDGWEVADKENDVVMTNIMVDYSSTYAGFTEGDPGYKAALKAAHDFGVANCATVIGKYIGEPLVPDPEIKGTYEAYLQDTALVHLINDAMLHYTNIYAAGDAFQSAHPEYAGMEVTLSGTAPLNTNANHRAGDITRGSVATIYTYDNNTLYILAMTGAQYKAWMEWSYTFIGPFIANNEYDRGPAFKAGDLTIPYGNGNMPGYNMDQFAGVSYKVDLTQPVGSRIVELKDAYTGEDFDLEQTYLVAVNNYRATTHLTTKTGNAIYGDGPKPVILAEEIEKTCPATGEGMLGVMIDYIQNELGGVIDNTDNAFFEPNWEYILPEIDPVLRARAVKAVNGGEIAITPVNGNNYARRAVNTLEVISAADFSDVDVAAWYFGAVDFAVKAGLMNGLGDGTFGPDIALTREMFVTLLYRMDGEEETNVILGFADVPAGQWYSKPIFWAQNNKLAQGIGDGYFGRGRNVSREEIATLLYRYMAYIGAQDGAEPGDLSAFDDAEDVSAWALDAMKWMVGAELMSGYDGALHPADPATRAQAATLFMRVMEYIENYEAAEEELDPAA